VERTVRDFGRDHWIVGSCQTTIWETAVALRGFENLLMDLIEDPELVGRILDIPQRYHTAVCRRLVELGVDMVWLGDDIGAQRSMIMSPDQWRMLLKPRFAELIAELKSINPAVKIAYHTDGYVEPIIGELIEIGIDVLHPVQPACMDPAKLKQQFGDRLCFMGTVDEQHTLPFGSVEDVRREVLGTTAHGRQKRRTHPGPHPPRPARHAGRKPHGLDRNREATSLWRWKLTCRANARWSPV
jgi:uroporphyrinogen-III decarboxylase